MHALVVFLWWSATAVSKFALTEIEVAKFVVIRLSLEAVARDHQPTRHRQRSALEAQLVGGGMTPDEVSVSLAPA